MERGEKKNGQKVEPSWEEIVDDTKAGGFGPEPILSH